MQALLPVLPHVQERGALRRAEPLVGVRRVIGRAEAREVERDHPEGVRAVHQRVHAARRKLGDETLDREDERRRARDVIQDREARVRRNARENAGNDFLFGTQRKRNFRHDDSRAGAGRHVVESLLARGVRVVRREEFVAGGERERADDRVHARRRVRDEREVVAVRPDERRQSRARAGDEVRQRADVEIHGLLLELEPQLRLFREDRLRARPERAVVQVGDGRVEKPEIGPGALRGDTRLGHETTLTLHDGPASPCALCRPRM